MATDVVENRISFSQTQESHEDADSSVVKKAAAVLALGAVVATTVVTGKMAYDAYEELKNPDYKIQIIDGISG